MNSSDPNAAKGSAEPVRLTTDGRFKRDPVFWPGGKDLIYTVLTSVTQMGPADHGMQGRGRLMRMQWADRSIAPFDGNVKHQTRSERELAVSTDGAVFAYCVIQTDAKAEIMVE